MENQPIDDVFYVEQKKYGLWHSVDKEGKNIVSSLNKEECVKATRFILKGRQEGWNKGQTIVKLKNSTVEGKL